MLAMYWRNFSLRVICSANVHSDILTFAAATVIADGNTIASTALSCIISAMRTVKVIGVVIAVSLFDCVN